jgi:hypothetical protein
MVERVEMQQLQKDALMRHFEVKHIDDQQIDTGVIVEFNNRTRHMDNRSILHGQFYKGTYYHHGIPQPHSKK